MANDGMRGRKSVVKRAGAYVSAAISVIGGIAKQQRKTSASMA